MGIWKTRSLVLGGWFVALGCGGREASSEPGINVAGSTSMGGQSANSVNSYAQGGELGAASGVGPGGTGAVPNTYGSDASGGNRVVPTSGSVADFGGASSGFGGFGDFGDSGGNLSGGSSPISPPQGGAPISGGTGPFAGSSGQLTGGSSGVGGSSFFAGSSGYSSGGNANGGSPATTYPFGGSSSNGGSSAVIPSCVPGASVACACADGSSGAQICQANGTYAPCACYYVISSLLVGSWVGSRTTTWDGVHDVAVTFGADGIYTAHCADDCVAMYWGSDDDSPQKTYSVQGVNGTGIGFGGIAIYFGPGNTNEGEMRNIAFDPTGSTVKFEVWKDRYGPLAFVLERVVATP